MQQDVQVKSVVTVLLRQRGYWGDRQDAPRPNRPRSGPSEAGPSNAPAGQPLTYQQVAAAPPPPYQQPDHQQHNPSHGNAVQVSANPNRRLPVPVKFHGRTDTHISCTQTWFDSLVHYMTMSALGPCEHFVFWLTGRAQEWGQSLLKLYADKGEPLTLPKLRAAFLLQYGDIRRHTEQEVRDRLFAGDHNMKPGERVQEYTQRFRDIIRDACSMSQDEMIGWYVHGLLVSMRRACGTDANGRDWKQLDDLIEYAQGQEVRSRIASVKTGSLNLVQTPRLNFAKTPRPKILKKQAPPPRPRLKTCRECGNATQNFKKHTASGECERIKAARDAPLPHHNEFNMGRGNGNNGARGRNGYQGGRGAGGDPMQH